MKKVLICLSVALTALLVACSSNRVDYSSQVATIDHGRWGITSFANHTETPAAGRRASEIAKGLMQAYHVDQMASYNDGKQRDGVLANVDQAVSEKELLNWGNRNRLRYVLTGSVNEWRYKVGIDGEPAVNVTMEVWDVRQRKIIWSVVGSRSGNSRQSVSAVAQDLIARSFEGLPAPQATFVQRRPAPQRVTQLQPAAKFANITPAATQLAKATKAKETQHTSTTKTASRTLKQTFHHAGARLVMRHSEKATQHRT